MNPAIPKVPTRESTPLNPRTTRLLRALVLAIAMVMISLPLTLWTGALAAALGGFAGALVAERAAQGRLRLFSGLGLAAGAWSLGILGVRLLVGSPAVAKLFGPVATIQLSEWALWLAISGPAIFALRFAARRRPLMAVLEVVVVAFAVAASFAAHRDGMVHRPLAIGDWAWSRGIDPAYVFLILGGLGTLLLAALLVAEERKRRLPLHFGALCIVALILMAVVRVGGLPKPQQAGDLGLTGDAETEEQEGEGQPQGGEGEASENDDQQMSDLPFRDEYQSQGQKAPLAVVVLHNDYSPPSGVYYFRQTVFSQFNGRRLVQSTRDDLDRDIMRRFPYRRTAIPDAPPKGEGRKVLSTSMGLMVDHVRPFALDSPVEITPIKNPNPLRFQRAFEVRSHVQVTSYDDMIGHRPGDASWSAEQWDHYTEAPSDPRYAELAERLLENLRPEYRSDPLGRALVIKDYLDQNGTYCRRSQHADATDPAASFLFGDLTGYCVHYAHAATYLMRSVDVPARVAAGYAVGEASRGNGSALLIRGADAHAWPEIYLQDIGWVVVDLTPNQQCEEENYENADPDLQRMLGEMMRNEPWQEDEDTATEPLTFATVAGWFLRLLAVLLAIAYTVKLYRFLAPRMSSQDLHRLTYRATLDRLADLGWRRSHGESREHFARRVGPLAPSFTTLTEHHLRWSLGSSRACGPEDIDRLHSDVWQELTTRVPTWRRVLGVLDPVSWMRVR